MSIKMYSITIIYYCNRIQNYCYLILEYRNAIQILKKLIMKTVVELPQTTFDKIERRLDRIDEIHEKLQELGTVKTPKYYTVKEFMQLAKIGRNKFEEIKNRLNVVRVSPRKIMIPHSDLVKWFSGEFI